MLVRWARNQFELLHSNVVIGINSNIYIFGSMTFNITHMRVKGSYNG